MGKRKAKYKIGDIVKIEPGVFVGFIGDHEKRAGDNTYGIITAIEEFYGFAPDYDIDFLSSDSIEFKSGCYDEKYIAGYANISFDDDDIYAEEMSFLFE